MSDIVAEFNPATAPQTSFTVPQSATNGALVFWNESNVALNISLQNGSTFYLPAWYNKHLCGYSGSVNVSWDIRTVLSSGLPPLSEIIVEAYAHGEHYPADGSLVRQTNGDTNSNVTTTQNVLINDGTAPNTQIIEATPSTGSSGSVLAIDNSGHFTLGDATNDQGVLTVNGDIVTSRNIISSNVLTLGQGGTAGNVMSANATNTHILATGAISLDAGGISGAASVSSSGILTAVGKLGQSAAGDIIDAAGSTTYVKGSSSIALQVPDGTTVMSVGSTTTVSQNFTLNSSKINRIGGNNIAAMSHFTATTSSSIVVNHNYANGTPNWIGITTNSAGSTATSGYNTVTSTQVTIVNGIGSNLTFSCVATIV